jgi:hypothetical protein
MNHLRWLGLTISISLLLVSCAFPKKEIFTCDLPTQSNSSQTELSNIKVAIHIDGSGSMLGYVSNPNSSYIETLKLVDNTFSLTSDVEYYRFGVKSKLNRSQFQKAQKPEFYNGKTLEFPGVSSDLAGQINSQKTLAQLLVLVTDLEQNDGDVTRVSQAIQKNYLNSNSSENAVAIVGIKSEFDGKIFNPSNPNIFSVYTQPNIRRRPFYLILMGSSSAISTYLAKLQQNSRDIINSNQIAIFSPQQPLKSSAYLSSSPSEIPKEVKIVKSLNNGKVALQSGDRIQLLKLLKKAPADLKFKDRVDLATINHTVPLDPQSIDTKINSEFFDKKAFRSADNSSIVELKEWQISSNKLDFVNQIGSEKFPEPGVYKFTIDVVARGLENINSKWEDWNWNSSQDKKDEGSKTRGLFTFLDGLNTISNDLMGKNPPLIARFCYGIQKE